MPVSYTHLDVYKRQLDHLLVNKETTADRIVEDFSKDLGLPKPMRKETILTVLDQERVAGTARQLSLIHISGADSCHGNRQRQRNLNSLARFRTHEQKLYQIASRTRT